MIIYKITNIINSKSYVGQTVYGLDRRWNQHNSKSSGCRALASAIRKHGKENFTIEIVAVCNSLSELNKQETKFIKEFNTLSPNGYNLTTGGEGKVLSEESKARISEANQGRKHSEDFRQSRRKNQTGKSHSEETKEKMSKVSTGKPKSDEHRFNISKSKTGTKLSSEHKNSIKQTLQIPIKCDQTGQVFASSADAAKELRIGKSTIIKILKKRKQSFKGLSFSYA